MHEQPSKPLFPILLLAAGLGAAAYVFMRPRNKPMPVLTPTRYLPHRLWVRESVTVGRPRTEVYAFWREISNLGKFMRHVKSVVPVSERESLWTVSIPAFGQFEWNAEITSDVPGEHVSWHSLKGSDVETSGEVEFTDAPGERGTEVIVTVEYRPPAGPVGMTMGRFLTPEIEQLIREDVRRFKSLMETGELPTTTGQPDGR